MFVRNFGLTELIWILLSAMLRTILFQCHLLHGADLVVRVERAKRASMVVWNDKVQNESKAIAQLVGSVAVIVVIAEANAELLIQIPYSLDYIAPEHHAKEGEHRRAWQDQRTFAPWTPALPAPCGSTRPGEAYSAHEWGIQLVEPSRSSLNVIVQDHDSLGQRAIQPLVHGAYESDVLGVPYEEVRVAANFRLELGELRGPVIDKDQTVVP